MRVRAGVTQW